MPSNLFWRKRSFQPWQNEHNSIMEGREEGKNNKQINLTWNLDENPPELTAPLKSRLTLDAWNSGLGPRIGRSSWSRVDHASANRAADILIYQDVRQYIGRQSPKGYMIFPLVNPFIHHVHSKTRLSDSMNYKTGIYTNLADVTANLVCWSNILTCAHDILTFQTCFLQMIESDKEICASTLQKSAELTDRQTSWYWFVRQIRSCFWN